MPVDEKTRTALDIKRLSLPADIAVTKLEAEDYTDSSGEPALRVLVVLDESVDVEKLTGEAIGNLKFAIRQSLRKNGINEFLTSSLRNRASSPTPRTSRGARGPILPSRNAGQTRRQEAKAGQPSPRGVVGLLRSFSFPCA